MGDHRLPPLRAGRRPAGLALLGWLTDERSPRLCRVAGAPGSGKSELLRWLAEAGTAEDAPQEQRVHAVLPAAGLTARGAVWSLAHALGQFARTAEDLLNALAEEQRRIVVCVPELGAAVDPAGLAAAVLDPLLRLPNLRLVVEAPTGSPEALAFTTVTEPAVLDLDLPQWTEQARFEAWCAKAGADPAGYPSPGAALGHGTSPQAPAGLAELAGRMPKLPDGTPDLAGAGEELLSAIWTAAAQEGDAGRLQADPLLLTYAGPVAVTTALEGAEGTVAAAWELAGPALIGEPDPAVRAAVLRARLIGVDDAAADRLAGVSGPWAPAWAMWPDSYGGWPGPVAGLAAGAGQYAGQLLLADPGGAVRTVDAAEGTPVGRVVVPGPNPLRGLTVTEDGTVVLLDAWGAVALVGEDTTAVDTALGKLRGEAGLSTLAAVPGLAGGAPALGDEAGAVRWYRTGEVLTAQLHHGPVTALAGALEEGEPLLVSGGFDGAVRLWRPGTEPSAEPFERRDCPVGAVALAPTPVGPVVVMAWADGLVRLRPVPAPELSRELRIGSQVWSLGAAAGLLVLGTSDGMAAVSV